MAMAAALRSQSLCLALSAIIVMLLLLAPSGVHSQDLPVHQPQQVHIALGVSPDILSAEWVTMDYPCVTDSTILYGESRDDMSMVAEGTCFTLYDEGDEHRNLTMHVAEMHGLKASTRYYYVVGDLELGLSAVFSVKTMPDAETIKNEDPMVIAVYGDQGNYNGQTITHLQLEAARQALDLIVHVGDMAYDLNSDNGRNGDEWMRDIEPYSANIPYMVCLGNHEESANYNHYTARFQNMPSNSGNISHSPYGSVKNNWYFSWNTGMVHWVAISTELYFHGTPDDIRLQYEFVMNDLRKANANRSEAPWVVVYGHRPLYCSCDGDCDSAATAVRDGILFPNETTTRYGMEYLFYKYGVDLYICGHEHNYERMYDVAPLSNPSEPWLSGKTTKTTVDMPATTYIVTGAAGNDEDHEPFTRPAPDRSAVRSNNYGYSRMHVYNATHLFWEQVMCDNAQPEEGRVIDAVWLVQHNHGPFANSTPNPAAS